MYCVAKIVRIVRDSITSVRRPGQIGQALIGLADVMSDDGFARLLSGIQDTDFFFTNWDDAGEQYSVLGMQKAALWQSHQEQASQQLQRDEPCAVLPHCLHCRQYWVAANTVHRRCLTAEPCCYGLYEQLALLAPDCQPSSVPTPVLLISQAFDDCCLYFMC